MKSFRNTLLILVLMMLSFSCEKNEANPFIGTWENYEITARGSNTTTMVFRSDMTMTYTMVVTVDDEDNTSFTDYYLYTSTTITIWEDDGQEETTEYIINDKYLVLSPGTDYEMTYTKTN
jgi:hypothetical protein